jgi:hypothetical protein
MRSARRPTDAVGTPNDCHDRLEHVAGQRHIGSYVATFYDQVGALLGRKLIDYDLADHLLGNSAIQLWEKIAHVIREARVPSGDPRLYEHFEFLYDEMSRRASAEPSPPAALRPRSASRL